jgi:glycosyltransferase involved in cell wall biosynthesis
MTILQVIPTLKSGGAERGTVDIAQSLIQAGHKAIVVSKGGRLVEELKAVGAEHIEMNVASKKPWTIYANINRLQKLIKEKNIDIIHARSRAPAWSAYYAAKRCHIPFVTTYHGLYNAKSFFKKYYNSIMAKGDCVIAVSEFMGEQIALRYPHVKQNIKVIPRGINLDHYCPSLISRLRIEQLIKQWNITDDHRQIILLPGRLTKIKGHEVLIDAVAKLSKKRDDFLCICPGEVKESSDYLKRLQDKIKQLDIGRFIRFPGHCLDMPAAYAVCDVVVAPSIQAETFGRVPVEAQVMGKPVIASDHGGFKETIIHGETGFLVKVGDANALANSLDEVLSISRKKRAEVSQQSNDEARHRYSVKKMCDATLAVYSALLNQQANFMLQENNIVTENVKKSQKIDVIDLELQKMS